VSAVRDLMKENMELRQRIAKRSAVAIQKNYISESQCIVRVVRARAADSALCFVVLFCIPSYLFVGAYE
jgi:hypothetical protein